ncbi:MAG: Cas10/Cmr2 second palm domain-containing protein [Sphaerospermopsis kisseleviana]
MYLVLIETSGNQNYIFSTNKLKENIGASELTYRAGTKWVLEAVEQVSKSNPGLSLFKNGQQLRDNILNEKLNPHIDTNHNIEVEVIVATSGKALLLTKEKATAQKIIQYVTHLALKEALGLDICGVIHEFDWDNDSLGEINRKIHQKFATVRSQRPAPGLRFLRLPIIDECSTSGLPASQIDSSERETVVRSLVTCSKRDSSEEGLKRIKELLRKEKPEINFPDSIRQLIDYLENEGIWLSVIHADGNGLGEIFLDFEKHIKIDHQTCAEANRNYVEKLRKFSIALDICTEKAFISALDAFKATDEKLVTIIPLVLGGDDLTVVCDGKIAIEFTKKFLTAFEKETKSQSQEHLDGIIPEIAEKALGVACLSACAGIAIIKPKFPFSVAYELAEKLMQSAKEVKKKVTHFHLEKEKPYPCSALDFHILYDSSSVDFKSIRSKLESENKKLHNRPYVVTCEDDLTKANGSEWAKFHQFSKLEAKIKVLVAKDENDGGKRKLPNSQMHDLKAGLFLGKEVSDARYRLIRDRYKEQDITTLAGSENSLFEKEPDSGIYITGLLDAIDAAEFLNVEEKNND